MARPGPAPKPSALRLVEGTDRRGRAGVVDVSREPVAPDELPEAPYDLAPEVLDEWHKVVAILDQMHLASSADANQIAAYCEAVILHRRASRTVAGSPILVKGDRSLVMNKAIIVQERAGTQMLRLAQEFGLTPAARTRVEVAKRASEEDTNPFAG